MAAKPSKASIIDNMNRELDLLLDLEKNPATEGMEKRLDDMEKVLRGAIAALVGRFRTGSPEEIHKECEKVMGLNEGLLRWLDEVVEQMPRITKQAPAVKDIIKAALETQRQLKRAKELGVA